MEGHLGVLVVTSLLCLALLITPAVTSFWDMSPPKLSSYSLAFPSEVTFLASSVIHSWVLSGSDHGVYVPAW